jgi:hypothetical protein
VGKRSDAGLLNTLLHSASAFLRTAAVDDAQLIVIENFFSLNAPRSSVTRTVNVNVPAVVGVPEMVFSPLGTARLQSRGQPALLQLAARRRKWPRADVRNPRSVSDLAAAIPDRKEMATAAVSQPTASVGLAWIYSANHTQTTRGREPGASTAETNGWLSQARIF